MQTVVIVIHLMVVLAMTGLVLLQRSEGGGLGMGGGGGFLTSRGTSNVLTRSTAILAATFFATSLLLSILAGIERKPRSILNTGAPAGPSAPLSAPSSLPLGNDRAAPAPQPGAPQSGAPQSGAPQPTGPQVPQSQ
ncbi:MAG: preprotein translocase subunit SecG [Variibacter sp.]|nr:preprotein translocase subunit SecG [Variibacter sp.]